MKNGRFEVGDIVVANKKSDDRYAITNHRHQFVGKVVHVVDNYDLSDDDDTIEIVPVNSRVHPGGDFWVNHRYFDLQSAGTTPAVPVVKSYDVVADTAIKRVIFNNPATIVFWKDGTKTVVKCQGEGKKREKYDKEKGLALCIAKKVLGNKSNFNNAINYWLSRSEE